MNNLIVNSVPWVPHGVPSKFGLDSVKDSFKGKSMKMTIKIILMGIIILFWVNLGVALAQSKSDRPPMGQGTSTQLEQYSESLFIFARWGTGNNELGFLRQPEGKFYPDMGPNAISVDKNENVYVLDPVNRRIVVYAKDGQPKTTIPLNSLDKYKIFDPWNNELFVDWSGSIYIRTQFLDFPFPNVAVVKINDAGELLSQYVPTAELREHFAPKTPQFEKFMKRVMGRPEMTVLSENIGKLSKLHIDNKGYVRGIVGDSMALNFSDNNISTVAIMGLPSGNIENSYVAEYQASLKKTSPKSTAQVRRLVLKNKRNEEISSVNPSEVVKYLPFGALVKNLRYIANDDFNNTYFLALVEGVSDGSRFVVKYRADGSTLLGIVAVLDTSDHPLAIGPSGSIYQLVWGSKKNNDGVKVLRWSTRK